MKRRVVECGHPTCSKSLPSVDQEQWTFATLLDPTRAKRAAHHFHVKGIRLYIRKQEVWRDGMLMPGEENYYFTEAEIREIRYHRAVQLPALPFGMKMYLDEIQTIAKN